MTRSYASLVRRLLLGLLAFPVVLLLWLFLAALAGDESFTEGVVHGGIVGAGLAAAIPVVLARRRWGKLVREGAPEDEGASGRLRTGSLFTLVTLVTIVVAGAGLSSYFGHAPKNLALPKVHGTPSVGQTLRADAGRWDARGADSLDFDYSWFRCRGQNCREFETTPEDEYVLTKRDLGARMRVSVIAYGDLNTVVDSKPTTVVRR